MSKKVQKPRDLLELTKEEMGMWDWGFGDWRLWIGPNPQSPIPNPQSPIPNPHKVISLIYILIYKL